MLVKKYIKIAACLIDRIRFISGCIIISDILLLCPSVFPLSAKAETVPQTQQMSSTYFHKNHVAQSWTNKIRWFSLKPAVHKNWEVIPDHEDPLKSAIIPRKNDFQVDITKKIIVLFAKKSSAYDIGLSRILTVFYNKRIPATFTIVNFKNDPILGRKYLNLARSHNFDLIIAMGSQSTYFVHNEYKKIRKGSIPVVTALSKDPVLLGQVPDYTSGSGTKIAYTSVAMPIESQMVYLNKLMPDLKNIGVMYGRRNKSAVESQVKPMKKIARKQNIHVIDVVVESKNIAEAAQELKVKIPAAIAEMKRDDPQLQKSTFWITGSTTVFDNLDTICRVANKVPVLSFSPQHVLEGEISSVLAVGVSFESNAHLAALFAIDILAGRKKPETMKVGVPNPPDIAINFQKAREIGLRIPFSFFESASFIYGPDGKTVRGTH